jgi:hypothetical protein
MKIEFKMKDKDQLRGKVKLLLKDRDPESFMIASLILESKFSEGEVFEICKELNEEQKVYHFESSGIRVMCRNAG